MSAIHTLTAITKLITAIDKLVRIIWVLVFWRRRATTSAAMRTLHRAGKDEDVRAAICGIKNGRYTLDAIDSNKNKLKKFAQAYGPLDSTLKKMLKVAKAELEAKRDAGIRSL